MAGDPDGIRRLASLHERHADAVRSGARHVVDAAEAAQSGWVGKAQERFVTVAATVPASAQRVAARLDEASSALRTYAREVQQIQDEAHRVQTAQQNAADDVAANVRAIQGATATAQSADAVESDTVRLHQLQVGAAGLRVFKDVCPCSGRNSWRGVQQRTSGLRRRWKHLMWSESYSPLLPSPR
jgi:uncharacterized protein YukE